MEIVPSVSLYLLTISPLCGPRSSSNNREPVCRRGMLYLSCSEDEGCGTDKDLQVCACSLQVRREGTDPVTAIRNTTQSGVKCAKTNPQACCHDTQPLW